MNQRKVERLMPFIVALEREPFKRSHLRVRHLIERVSETTGIHADISSSTLMRLHEAFLEDPLGRAHNSPKRGPYTSELQIDLFVEIVDDLYLCKKPLSGAALYVEFRKLLKQLHPDEKAISRSTFYEWLNQLAVFKVLNAQQGFKQARAEFRTSKSRMSDVGFLERAEIDAVHISTWILVDGAPSIVDFILYMMIEVKTRMIMGYHLQSGKGETAPGYRECILNGIGQKSNPDIWPTCGVPSILVGDAAQAFLSRSLKKLTTTAGITHQTTPAAKPYHKPFIERFFGTLRKQFCLRCAGYLGTLANPSGISRAKPPKGLLTLDEFESQLFSYITSIYHKNLHSGLGCSPEEEWKRQVALIGEISEPRNLEKLKTLRCEEHQRVVKQGSVVVENIYYFCQELHDLLLKEGRHRNKNEVTVLMDEEDLATVTLVYLSRQGEVQFEAQATNPVVRGMSMKRWKSLTKYEQIHGPEPDQPSTSQTKKKKRKQRRPAVNTEELNRHKGVLKRPITKSASPDGPSVSDLIDEFMKEDK
ncbi:MAG: DDE-type integrase/transposase/recombinase [Oceanospirillaceae bacterium]|nr:DDE-type integrase/transposase/recombinase [Oceanospirillaceae bacterium]